MAKDTKADESKPAKRVRLSDTERLAKMQADLEAAKAKAADKAKAKVKAMHAEIDKVAARITSEQVKLEALNAELTELEVLAGGDQPAG